MEFDSAAAWSPALLPRKHSAMEKALQTRKVRESEPESVSRLLQLGVFFHTMKSRE